MKKQNAFHNTHILPVSELMEYVYLRAIMSASDFTQTEYRDVKIFMQYRVFIWYFQ